MGISLGKTPVYYGDSGGVRITLTVTETIGMPVMVWTPPFQHHDVLVWFELAFNH